jgi:DNA invertase Pin-like site-specific DNA recombinase
LEGQRRPFNYLLVSDLSRLSRSLSLAAKIANVFHFHGVAIHSVADGAILDLEKLASLSALFM